jgi:glutamyl-tRNA reductase
MQVDQIMIIGVNHKVAPVEVREKLAYTGDCAHPVIELGKIPGCKECCFLGTCNRVEVIFSGNDGENTAMAVRKFLFSRSKLNDEEAKKYSYFYKGQEAVNHLFRVAASLDSMIVGEPQILGQLKGAYREAREHNSVSLILNKFINKSFSVAKRTRTETNIGGSAVSISYAAVQLAKKIFGNLDHKKVMLVGAGEMAELAAEHLIAQGISEVVVANRTLANALKLAERFKGSAVSLEEIASELESVDILISSTGAAGLVLKKEDLKPIMRRRMESPLFLIDIAVPRDLDPGLNDLDNVYLYDIDNLKDVVDVNKSERQKEADKAERIVEEETLKFMQWLEGMEVTPTIVEMRQKIDDIRQAEVDKTLAGLGELSSKQKKSIEAMAGAITNKILHNPILFLKSETSSIDQQLKLQIIREIFGIDSDS